MPFVHYYIFVLLALVPMVRIFERAGFKPYWALLLAVPDLGLLFCMAALALKKWPQKGRA